MHEAEYKCRMRHLVQTCGHREQPPLLRGTDLDEDGGDAGLQVGEHAGLHGVDQGAQAVAAGHQLLRLDLHHRLHHLHPVLLQQLRVGARCADELGPRLEPA